jgi:hypothetical protein
MNFFSSVTCDVVAATYFVYFYGFHRMSLLLSLCGCPFSGLFLSSYTAENGVSSMTITGNNAICFHCFFDSAL